MLRHLSLSHHKHSGKVLPHKSTSYLPLALLLLSVGFVLSVVTSYAASPGPEAGSIGVTGVMPAKPPTIAPTIDTPKSSQRFTTSPVTVTGKCPAGTLVEVFKNDIFAGSTFCSDKGNYSFDIDLLFGDNTLVARVYDALNQSSPPSETINVIYDSQLPQANSAIGLDFGSAQLIINTDAVYRGIFPGKQLSMPLTLLGGKAPFAVNVLWGDEEESLIPRDNNAVFNAVYAYKKPGTYPIRIKATDADGRVAFLTVAAVVNGQPEATSLFGTSSSTENGELIGTLFVLWPVYVSLFAIVVGFWLGEIREKHLLQKRGQLIR